MTTTDPHVSHERTFLALTYFELAYLLAGKVGAHAVLRSILPLADENDPSDEYLEKGRALLTARTSVLTDGDTLVSEAVDLVVDGLAHSDASVVLSLGASEPTVVAAFVGPEFMVELITLPGGQLLLGALRAVPLDATVLPSYAFQLGAESMQLLASRADDTKLWLSYSNGVLRGASGDSFDTKANGPSWREAVPLIFQDVDFFLYNN